MGREPKCTIFGGKKLKEDRPATLTELQRNVMEIDESLNKIALIASDKSKPSYSVHSFSGEDNHSALSYFSYSSGGESMQDSEPEEYHAGENLSIREQEAPVGSQSSPSPLEKERLLRAPQPWVTAKGLDPASVFGAFGQSKLSGKGAAYTTGISGGAFANNCPPRRMIGDVKDD